MASPMRKLKLLGRRMGRSMLRMNRRERVRKRKAERYFGGDTKIFEEKSSDEPIISEETDRNLSTGDHEEDLWDTERDEEIF